MMLLWSRRCHVVYGDLMNVCVCNILCVPQTVVIQWYSCMYYEQYVLNLSLRLLDAADHIIIEWHVGLAVSDHILPFRATIYCNKCCLCAAAQIVATLCSIGGTV